MLQTSQVEHDPGQPKYALMKLNKNKAELGAYELLVGMASGRFLSKQHPSTGRGAPHSIFFKQSICTNAPPSFLEPSFVLVSSVAAPKHALIQLQEHCCTSMCSAGHHD